MKNVTLALLLSACFVLGCGWQGSVRAQKTAPRASATPQQPPPRRKAPEPVEVYTGLRGQFLKIKPGEFDLEKPGPDSKAYGVLMEMGYESGLASIISLNSGEASLYTGTGGGVIGGGGHESVNRAARAFVVAAGKHLPRMAVSQESPYADIGRVRFYVLTADGVYAAEAGHDEMVDTKHPLHALYRAGHEVITQLRLTTEKVEKKP
jgi:hypothetical protein